MRRGAAVRRGRAAGRGGRVRRRHDAVEQRAVGGAREPAEGHQEADVLPGRAGPAPPAGGRPSVIETPRRAAAWAERPAAPGVRENHFDMSVDTLPSLCLADAVLCAGTGAGGEASALCWQGEASCRCGGRQPLAAAPPPLHAMLPLSPCRGFSLASPLRSLRAKRANEQRRWLAERAALLDCSPFNDSCSCRTCERCERTRLNPPIHLSTDESHASFAVRPIGRTRTRVSLTGEKATLLLSKCLAATEWRSTKNTSGNGSLKLNPVSSIASKFTSAVSPSQSITTKIMLLA